MGLWRTWEEKSYIFKFESITSIMRETSANSLKAAAVEPAPGTPVPIHGDLASIDTLELHGEILLEHPPFELKIDLNEVGEAASITVTSDGIDGSLEDLAFTVVGLGQDQTLNFIDTVQDISSRFQENSKPASISKKLSSLSELLGCIEKQELAIQYKGGTEKLLEDYHRSLLHEASDGGVKAIYLNSTDPQSTRHTTKDILIPREEEIAIVHITDPCPEQIGPKLQKLGFPAHLEETLKRLGTDDEVIVDGNYMLASMPILVPSPSDHSKLIEGRAVFVINDKAVIVSSSVPIASIDQNLDRILTNLKSAEITHEQAVIQSFTELLTHVVGQSYPSSFALENITIANVANNLTQKLHAMEKLYADQRHVLELMAVHLAEIRDSSFDCLKGVIAKLDKIVSHKENKAEIALAQIARDGTRNSVQARERWEWLGIATAPPYVFAGMAVTFGVSPWLGLGAGLVASAGLAFGKLRRWDRLFRRGQD